MNMYTALFGLTLSLLFSLTVSFSGSSGDVTKLKGGNCQSRCSGFIYQNSGSGALSDTALRAYGNGTVSYVNLLLSFNTALGLNANSNAQSGQLFCTGMTNSTCSFACKNSQNQKIVEQG